MVAHMSFDEEVPIMVRINQIESRLDALCDLVGQHLKFTALPPSEISEEAIERAAKRGVDARAATDPAHFSKWEHMGENYKPGYRAFARAVLAPDEAEPATDARMEMLALLIDLYAHGYTTMGDHDRVRAMILKAGGTLP